VERGHSRRSSSARKPRNQYVNGGWLRRHGLGAEIICDQSQLCRPILVHQRYKRSLMTIAWVSSVMLEWVPIISSSELLPEDKWQEPHRIWQHVRRRLSSSTTLHDREDAIVALRRAIDRRIRHLKEIYQFRSIPGVNRKAKIIDILKDLSIVHPIML
jgi:hypothetical protein